MTLAELLELYEVTVERQTRLMKTVAAAMGADVSDSSSSSSSRSSSANQTYDIKTSSDLALLPINIGYETMDSNG